MQSRRRFLQQSALVSLAPWVPAFLPHSLAAATAGQNERILVVIQLDGGNDGLNTVIPFAHEKYARFRPELRIAEKDVLKLNDSLGLNPGMKGMQELFGDGRLAIVQGVGYPNPNRSHFESMSIWQHARLDAAQHDSIGWLGRAADLARRGESSTPDSIFLGGEAIPVALRGRRANAVSLENEADLKLLSPGAPAGRESPLDADLTSFVQRTVDRSYDAAKQFQESEPAAKGDGPQYPTTKLATKLKLISRLIKLGGGTRVYYVSQSGYDTHSAQLNKHRQLLSELSGGLKAFLNDLKDSQLEDRVTVLAFSEFGRRVKENGSAGTDHGAAGPVFVAGQAVRGGLVGEHPSLDDLDAGDLKMAIDFRGVYAAVLGDWLGAPADPILAGNFRGPRLFSPTL